MGKSVKLTDGSYIDSEGIYDATQGKTQSALNSSFVPGTWFDAGRHLQVYGGYSAGAKSINITLSNTYMSIMGILITRSGIQFLNVYRSGSQIEVCELVNQHTGGPTKMPTISYTGNVCTIALSTYTSWTLICTVGNPVSSVSVTST